MNLALLDKLKKVYAAQENFGVNVPKFWSFPEFKDLEKIIEDEENYHSHELSEHFEDIIKYNVEFPDPDEYIVGFFSVDEQEKRIPTK